MNTEDMLAIQQAIARYSYTFDYKDADGLANIFTDDAIWEHYPAGETKPRTRLEGHAELLEFARTKFRERPEDITVHHHQSGILFDALTPDAARTRTMLMVTRQKGEEPAVIGLTGVYTDLWQKTPAGWKLAHRVLRP